MKLSIKHYAIKRISQWDSMPLYTTWNRIKYCLRFGWFYRKNILGISFPMIPRDFDIFINETFWSIKRRK